MKTAPMLTDAKGYDMSSCARCGAAAVRPGCFAQGDAFGNMKLRQVEVADHTSLRCRACGLVFRKADVLDATTHIGLLLRARVANMRVRLTEELSRIWGAA